MNYDVASRHQQTLDPTAADPELDRYRLLRHRQADAEGSRITKGRSMRILLTRIRIGAQSPVPVFASGAQAAAHGLSEVDAPGTAARKVIEKLTLKRQRSASSPQHAAADGRDD